MTHDSYYVRACDRDIGSAIGSDFPPGKVPAIADRETRHRVFRADAIRVAFADLANFTAAVDAGKTPNESDLIQALRGYAYAKEMHGKCGGFGPPQICDALTALQNGIEAEVTKGTLARLRARRSEPQ